MNTHSKRRSIPFWGLACVLMLFGMLGSHAEGETHDSGAPVRREGYVAVGGYVYHPNQVRWTPSLTLAEAIAAVGGVMPHKLSRSGAETIPGPIFIYRRGTAQKEVIPLRDFQSKTKVSNRRIEPDEWIEVAAAFL